jgi:hypothetical protein
MASNVIEQPGMITWVGEVRAAGEDRHSVAAAGQGGAMGGDVDAVGTTGVDHPAADAKSSSDLRARVPAIGGGRPGANQGDRLAAKVPQIRLAAYP